MKRFWAGFGAGFLILASILGGAIGDRLFGWSILDQWLPQNNQPVSQKVEVVKEENIVIDVVDEMTPSVVTIGIKKTEQIIDPKSLFFDPFSFFNQSPQVQEKEIEQDIGSGFIVSSEGLIVTNKHVVSNTRAEYQVITADSQEYKVEKIYRDPVNDLAILKINGSGFKSVSLGNSDDLKVGQFVIAIGTALGEFRSTVTTGVISGLGRGIQAGDIFSGRVESLDNVIQTDAAINPGNSGGPLLNIAGQVIGISVATTQGAENIGFAIPINVVKQSLTEFEETGRFSRAFLGVRYKMIDQETALLNDVPQGAYIVEIVKDSPAEKSGLKKGDIITEIAGQKLKDVEGGLAAVIGQHRVGETIDLKIWRQEEASTVDVKLEEAGQ